MLKELSDYLPFHAGHATGASPPTSTGSTRVYEANTDSQLFINQTGTDAWRPEASSDHVSNLYVAGDFCNNDIGMTTIESAVTTGLAAARGDRRA